MLLGDFKNVKKSLKNFKQVFFQVITYVDTERNVVKYKEIKKILNSKTTE